MRYYVCILAVFGTLLYSGVSSAKIYWLPDYLGKNMERTYVPQDGSHSNEVSCSSYGMYNSTQSGMTCNISYPASGLTCYSCQACDSEYKYTTVDCPTSTYTLANQCGGNYKNCNCNTALYPTTTTTGGCPSGQAPDPNSYCEDKPSGTKHYACADVNCNPENITVDECQAKGAGYGCTPSTEANCTGYCDTNGCRDNCAYLTQTGQALSNCQYGCASGKGVSGCSGLCYECAAAPDAPTNTCADIYDGKSNTATITNQLGADALAATAANQFYVGDKNGDFGQGKWYLPSIGELVDMYGVNSSKITNGSGTSGALGGYKKRINTALKTLKTKGAEAEVIILSLWSSSEGGNSTSWVLSFSNGNRGTGTKVNTGYVRPFQLLENCFAPAGSGVTAPKVGNVLYADKTWGSADDYDGSKQAVGIISAVGNDGSVKIVSLKFLTFSSQGSAGNFNPDNPYGGSVKVTQWITQDKDSVNVVGVPNYSISQLKTMLKKCATDEKLCSGPTIAECNAIGHSKCDASTEDGCSNYCDSKGCMDICRYEQVVNNAVSNCQYGCATCKSVSDCSEENLCYECATEQQSKCSPATNGQKNTQVTVATGSSSGAAQTANQHYVGDKSGYFGQGKWYLPSIGEWMELYGVNTAEISSGEGNSGATGTGKSTINQTLTILQNNSVDAAVFSDVGYWSSTGYDSNYAWRLDMSSGSRGSGTKAKSFKVRPMFTMETCFDLSDASAPKVGDIVYVDGTWEPGIDFYAGKNIPVGVVAIASNGEVKIIGLKDLASGPWGGVSTGDVSSTFLLKCYSTAPCVGAVTVNPNLEECTSYCPEDQTKCMAKRKLTCNEAIQKVGTLLEDGNSTSLSHNTYYLTKDVTFYAPIMDMIGARFKKASTISVCAKDKTVVKNPKLSFQQSVSSISNTEFYVDTDISELNIADGISPSFMVAANVKIDRYFKHHNSEATGHTDMTTITLLKGPNKGYTLSIGLHCGGINQSDCYTRIVQGQDYNGGGVKWCDLGGDDSSANYVTCEVSNCQETCSF